MNPETHITLKQPKRSQRQASFAKAPLVTRVQLAAPLARELALNGLRDIDKECSGYAEMYLTSHIEQLIGHAGDAGIDDAGMALAIDGFEAAYALGIAVGLLLRPDVFEKIRAR
jgi:hypothetical protein